MQELPVEHDMEGQKTSQAQQFRVDIPLCRDAAQPDILLTAVAPNQRSCLAAVLSRQRPAQFLGSWVEYKGGEPASFRVLYAT